MLTDAARNGTSGGSWKVMAEDETRTLGARSADDEECACVCGICVRVRQDDVRGERKGERRAQGRQASAKTTRGKRL